MLAESATDAPGFTLVISEKGGAERRQIFRGDEVSLGRVQGNDIVLPKGNVSKRHARILFREGRLVVTDLNSTNGTYVNRRRITQATIFREEDRLFIGDYVLRVEGASPADRGPSELHDTGNMTPPVHVTFPPFQADESTGSVTLSPSDRSSNEELGRASAVPLSRNPESVSEPSHPSQRLLDLAHGHRAAVAHTVATTLAKKGDPPLVPDAVVREEYAEFVVQAVDQLLVDGGIPVGTSADAVREQALAELLDVGPLRALLADPEVYRISAIESDELVEMREGRGQSISTGFSSRTSLRRALRRLLFEVVAPAELGSASEAASFEVELPGGAELSVVFGKEPLEGTVFSLRKPRSIETSLDDLVRRGALSRAMATVVSQCVLGHMNILVTGPEDEGLHIVQGALCTATHRERVVNFSIFDNFVVRGSPAVRVAHNAGLPDLRRKLRAVAHLSGSRLAVSMATPELALAVVDAVGGGASGILASLPSGSLDRALRRLPADIVAQQAGLDLDAAAAWIEGSFDLALEVLRLRDGRIRVLRIAELTAEGGKLVAHDIFRFAIARVLPGGAVEGNFVPTGRIPRLATELQAAGTRIETSLFSRPPSR